MVGNSCGVGALKGWDGTRATHIEPIAFRTESILAYGPVRTIVDVAVKGWNYQGKELNMTNRYILYAGHRDLLVETFFDEPLENEVFCTGVQNIMGNETRSESDHKGLIGSWGRHWPVNDTVKYAKETVGIATYIPQKYIRQEVKIKIISFIPFLHRAATVSTITPCLLHARKLSDILLPKHGLPICASGKKSYNTRCRLKSRIKHSKNQIVT